MRIKKKNEIREYRLEYPRCDWKYKKSCFLGLKMELLLSKLSGRDIHKVLIKKRENLLVR